MENRAAPLTNLGVLLDDLLKRGMKFVIWNIPVPSKNSFCTPYPCRTRVNLIHVTRIRQFQPYPGSLQFATLRSHHLAIAPFPLNSKKILPVNSH